MGFLSRHKRRLCAACIFGVLLFLLRAASLLYACAVTGSLSYQPLISQAITAFHNAGSNNLGPGYPTLPNLESGYPDKTLVSPSIPCVILKAIAYVESSWHQAWHYVPRGSKGETLATSSCGYGVMQITSCMHNPGDCGLPPDVQQKIAEDYIYNIGWGAKMLADKWNAGDYWKPEATIGNRDPQIAENWYYAVWAYHYWGWKNNPNNPELDWPRPPFDGSQDRTGYPYQELVWGYAAHPPSEGGAQLWDAIPLTLPPREAICSDPVCQPGWINTPQPSHQSPCTTSPMEYQISFPDIRKRS